MSVKSLLDGVRQSADTGNTSCQDWLKDIMISMSYYAARKMLPSKAYTSTLAVESTEGTVLKPKSTPFIELQRASCFN